MLPQTLDLFKKKKNAVSEKRNKAKCNKTCYDWQEVSKHGRERKLSDTPVLACRISCPSTVKQVRLPWPRTESPHLSLGRNVARESALVQIILKAKIWAIWGNFNFPILESKFQLLVLKQCVTRNTAFQNKTGNQAGLASADVVPRQTSGRINLILYPKKKRKNSFFLILIF